MERDRWDEKDTNNGKAVWYYYPSFTVKGNG